MGRPPSPSVSRNRSKRTSCVVATKRRTLWFPTLPTGRAAAGGPSGGDRVGQAAAYAGRERRHALQGGGHEPAHAPAERLADLALARGLADVGERLEHVEPVARPPSSVKRLLRMLGGHLQHVRPGACGRSGSWARRAACSRPGTPRCGTTSTRARARRSPGAAGSRCRRARPSATPSAARRAPPARPERRWTSPAPAPGHRRRRQASGRPRSPGRARAPRAAPLPEPSETSGPVPRARRRRRAAAPRRTDTA